MKIKGAIFEDFVNFKLPAMYIAFGHCTFKCDAENGQQLCQNCKLASQPDIEVTKESLIERYISNPITKAIVLAGLEPLDDFTELFAFIDCVRRQYHLTDPIVIYTGYTEEECINGQFSNSKLQKDKTFAEEWKLLLEYGVIVKYGRYRPNQEPHYDEVLGVYLASDNQYAKEYSAKFDFL